MREHVSRVKTKGFVMAEIPKNDGFDYGAAVRAVGLAVSSVFQAMEASMPGNPARPDDRLAVECGALLQATRRLHDVAAALERRYAAARTDLDRRIQDKEERGGDDAT